MKKSLFYLLLFIPNVSFAQQRIIKKICTGNVVTMRVNNQPLSNNLFDCFLSSINDSTQKDFVDISVIVKIKVVGLTNKSILFEHFGKKCQIDYNGTVGVLVAIAHTVPKKDDKFTTNY